MNETWDEQWKSFKENHIAALKSCNFSDEEINKDFQRLFKIIKEYTPYEYQAK